MFSRKLFNIVDQQQDLDCIDCIGLQTSLVHGSRWLHSWLINHLVYLIQFLNSLYSSREYFVVDFKTLIVFSLNSINKSWADLDEEDGSNLFNSLE